MGSGFLLHLHVLGRGGGSARAGGRVGAGGRAERTGPHKHGAVGRLSARRAAARTRTHVARGGLLRPLQRPRDGDAARQQQVRAARGARRELHHRSQRARAPAPPRAPRRPPPRAARVRKAEAHRSLLAAGHPARPEPAVRSPLQDSVQCLPVYL